MAPQNSPITAQSADGVQHQFPAGTDQAVIDRVMKDYATSKQAGDGVIRWGSDEPLAKTFKITAPDGRVFNVTGANAQGALAALQQHLGDAKTAPNVFNQFDGPGTLTIGGKQLKVDRNFANLSPADQQKTVDEIAGQLGITAQSADGVLHQFPAGTNQAVIDRVMKEYATTANSPSWRDLPGNILPSAGNAITGLANMVAHPVQTVESLGQVGIGAHAAARDYLNANLPAWATAPANAALNAVDPVYGAAASLANPTQTETSKAVAGAVGQGLKDRYWGLDNLKRTAVTDPIGALADIGTLAAGGEGLLGRIGLEGSRAADLAGIASRATNPANLATAAVSKTVPLAGKSATYLLGLASGADPKALQIAGQAGYAGGDTSNLFRAALRGQDTPDALVSDAKAALDTIAEQRRANYLNGIAGTASSTATVDTAPIRQTLNDLRDSLYVNPQNAAGGNASTFAPLQKGSNADLKTMDTIDSLLSQWEAHPEGRTPLGMDALKQRLNELQPSFADSGAANQRRLVTAAQDAIRNQITAVEPSYARAMADYSGSKAASDAITKSLSLGPRASVDTAFAKLQSALRGDKANRTARVADLEAQSPGLIPRIAGQSLNDWTPKGNVAKAFAGLLGGTGYFNPTQLGLLPLTSPRFNAELAYAAGRGSGRVAGLLGKVDPERQRLMQMIVGGQLLGPAVMQ